MRARYKMGVYACVLTLVCCCTLVKVQVWRRVESLLRRVFNMASRRTALKEEPDAGGSGSGWSVKKERGDASSSSVSIRSLGRTRRSRKRTRKVKDEDTADAGELASLAADNDFVKKEERVSESDSSDAEDDESDAENVVVEASSDEDVAASQAENEEEAASAALAAPLMHDYEDISRWLVRNLRHYGRIHGWRQGLSREGATLWLASDVMLSALSSGFDPESVWQVVQKASRLRAGRTQHYFLVHAQLEAMDGCEERKMVDYVGAIPSSGNFGGKAKSGGKGKSGGKSRYPLKPTPKSKFLLKATPTPKPPPKSRSRPLLMPTVKAKIIGCVSEPEVTSSTRRPALFFIIFIVKISENFSVRK